MKKYKASEFLPPKDNSNLEQSIWVRDNFQRDVYYDDPRYKLWEHMSDEHDLILTDGELWDIIHLVRELDKTDLEDCAHQLEQELAQVRWENEMLGRELKAEKAQAITNWERMRDRYVKVVAVFEELLVLEYSVSELRDMWRERAGIPIKDEE